VSIYAADFSPEDHLISSVQQLVASAIADFGLSLGVPEGITIFVDYNRGISQFDTGLEDGALSASKGSLVGVGMTPLVLREGKLRSHVLLPRQVAESSKAQDDSEHARKARYAIVHELAHCDDHENLATRFGAELLDTAARRNMLDVGCRATWSEYYVCRTVAKQYPELLRDLEESAVRALESFEAESRIAAHYASIGDREEGQSHAFSAGFNLLIVLARLLGHLDGLSISFENACRIAPAYLSNLVLISDIEHLHNALDVLWSRRPDWTALSEVRSLLTPLSTILNRI
jgi:hypothetical protein